MSLLARSSAPPFALQRMPALAATSRRLRTADGRLVLQSADGRTSLDVGAAEEALLDLIDGGREVDEILRAATSLDPPRSPLLVMALLRKLGRRGFIDGAVDPLPTAAVPGATRPVARPSAPPPRRAMRLPLPRAFVAPLLRLPRAAFSAAMTLAGLAVVVAVTVAAARGHLPALLDPFVVRAGAARALVELYASAVVALSVRGFTRGLALRAVSLTAPRAVVSVTTGVVHLDADDRARGVASRPDRALVAWGGLGGLCLAAAVGAVLTEATGAMLARRFTAVAILALLADAAPYLHTDTWHLVGMYARIPQQRQRATSFLLRRFVQNVRRRVGVGAIEGTYLWVASAWLVHGVVALWVTLGVLAGGSLTLLRTAAAELAYRTSPASVAGLVGCALVTLGMFAVATALLVAFAALVVAAGRQLLAGPRISRPASSGPLSDAEAGEVARVLSASAFLAPLGEATIERVARSMRRESYPKGAVLRAQGIEEARFCVLVAGAGAREVEEESGLVHEAAPLLPGDTFGEPALVSAATAPSTVRAREPTVQASIDRGAFEATLPPEVDASVILATLSDAACLRRQPVFEDLSTRHFGRLLGAARRVSYSPGDRIVRQGDRADALYVVREGSCGVTMERTSGEAVHVGDLGPDDVFGELALLEGGSARTATVTAKGAVTVLRIEADAVARLFLEDPRTARLIEELAAERRRANRSSA